VKTEQIITGAVLALAVATAVSAHRAAASGSTVTPEAVAYHGAMQLYRNLAVHFGKRALLAEAAYWKAVA
jgi:hypothetical protein